MSRFGGLRQRLPTAIVLAVALLLVLFALPPTYTLLLIALAIVGGAWEWSAFLNLPRRGPRFAYLLLVASGLVLGWWVTPTSAALATLLGLAALWWLAALGWLMLAPARGGRVATALAGLLALIPTGVALAWLRLEEQGAWLVLLALGLVMAADIGAYFAGHLFGRSKLAPQVSPGKTWEGVFGGCVAAMLVAGIAARLLGWPLLQLLLLALVSAAFSVVGDLTESLMKRHSGLKDSGHLFPGHGGVLDRFDSLSAGVPVFVLGLLQSGLIAGPSAAVFE